MGNRLKARPRLRGYHRPEAGGIQGAEYCSGHCFGGLLVVYKFASFVFRLQDKYR